MQNMVRVVAYVAEQTLICFIHHIIKMSVVLASRSHISQSVDGHSEPRRK